MESLSQTSWDVVIEGTSLQQSLLALALSRSDKKILHLDQNNYYGSADAAFSLQDIDEWVKKVEEGSIPQYRKASTWKGAADKLSFSRAYNLTLSPHIVYTRSKLLSYLVSSKVYRQLEFQAVGNWWINDLPAADSASGNSNLRRLPNGREDIFQDDSLDNRAKRSLMKFLKFVTDYENQRDIWEAHAAEPLSTFLSTKFQLPPNLQHVIAALTLSLEVPQKTIVEHSLPRIARHLTSIGVFGPGFGAIFPKWGGGAEIAQVACRSGAVGGGTYVLGVGVKDGSDYESSKQIMLSNGETVTTEYFAQDSASMSASSRDVAVSKVIAIISSPLDSLFVSTAEGAPTSAVSVVAFPGGTLAVGDSLQPYPVFVMIHSSETGECPAGQCVLYCTTFSAEIPTPLIDTAISKIISSVDEDAEVLYKLTFQQCGDSWVRHNEAVTANTPASDLAFDDHMLDYVEQTWKEISGQDVNDSAVRFMKFGDRKGQYAEDDDEA